MTRAPRMSWLLAATLAASAGVAHAQSPADAVVQQLREQGYVEFEVTRTLLGRIQVIARAPDGEQREIVFNPATGEILRDYSEAADGVSAAPRILDSSGPAGRPQAATSPRGSTPPPGGGQGTDQGGGAPSGGGNGGDRGHGNDDDGSDDDNPGRGQGNGNGNGNGGNSGNPSRDGGNGNGRD